MAGAQAPISPGQGFTTLTFNTNNPSVPNSGTLPESTVTDFTGPDSDSGGTDWSTDASALSRVPAPNTVSGLVPKATRVTSPAAVETVDLLSDSSSEGDPQDTDPDESESSDESKGSGQPSSSDDSEDSEDSDNSEDSSDSDQSDKDLTDPLVYDQVARLVANLPGLSEQDRFLTLQRVRAQVRKKPTERLSGPPAILMATPDRPYSTFEGVDRQGTIFPDGYEKMNYPDYPWICPIRSCRKVFQSRAAIGGHMSSKHSGNFLNDNGDGTVSITGTDPGPNHRHPIVVSKKPLDPNEPPMALPTLANPTRSQKRHITPPELESTELVSSDHFLTAADLVGMSHSKEAGPQESDQGDTAKMWNYIRPFLVRNKEAQPTRGWVPELITLPRVRDLEWNTAWTDNNPYIDSQDKDVSALIVQLTGEPASTPCTRCQGGRGPFLGCILISKAAPAGPKSAITGCANCLYHMRQTYCSHNPASRNAGKIGNETPTESPRVASAGIMQVKVPASTPVSNGVVSGSSPSHLTPAQRKTLHRVFKPSEINILEMASPDRPYKALLDANGNVVSSSGTIIPEGYKLDYTIPDLPWICPVRDCRLVFKGPTQLGCHFGRRHRGELFNDNEDGTLGTVGSYNIPLEGMGTSLCAFVIARGKPALDQPLATPNVPGMVKQDESPASSTYRHRADSQANRATSDELPAWLQYDTKEDAENALTMWRYIKSQLPEAKEIPREKRVKELLALPRVRDANWSPGFPRKSAFGLTEEDPNHILGMLNHLTGDTVEPDTPCLRCQEGHGAFGTCVIVSRNAPEHVWKNFSCCANCFYSRSQYGCNAREAYRKRFLPNGSANVGKKNADPIATDSQPSRKRRRLDSDEVTITWSPSDNARQKHIWKHELAWESAPGRLQTVRDEGIENVAFSQTYLSSNKTVKVDNGVSFSIHNVQPGQSLPFDADNDNTRICSVASGLLRVKLGDEKEKFTISTHGVFKVKTGIECTVYNPPGGDEANLHVTLLYKDFY